MVKILHSDVDAVDRIVTEITKMEGRRPRVTAKRRNKETVFTITVES
jgi:hypothetical protein